MNPWTYLFIGIVFEVAGTSCLKFSNGFSDPLWLSLCMACFICALFALSLSVKTLDLSIVYAIWSGVGITMVSVIGVLFFQEQITFYKVLFISLIVIGVSGLQMISWTH